MKIIKTILFSTIAAFTIACAANQPKPIFIGHLVTYDEADKIVKAQMFFKGEDTTGGGKHITLAEAPNLNGTPLKLIKYNNSYQVDGAKAQFDSVYRLGFKNPNTSQLFEYDYAFRPARNLMVEKGVLSLTKGGKISWQGAPLGSGETLLLRVEDTLGSVQKEINIVGGAGDKEPSFTFAGEQLEGVQAGAVKIFPIRRRTIKLSTNPQNVQGVVETEYYALPIQVMVEK